MKRIFKKEKLGTTIGVLIILGCLFGLFYSFNKNDALKKKLDDQNKIIQQQSQLIESSQKDNSIQLLNYLFDKIEEEIKSNPNKSLSDNTIKRISELNYSFEASKKINGDSLLNPKWSFERGLLLKRLISIDLDSNSFIQIKNQITFEGADLREANLNGIDLSGIDLKKANLKKSDLTGTNLSKAILSDANLWGANLQMTTLLNCTLHRADLRWVDLSGADLGGANLNGANLNDAKLMKTNLHLASLEWAKARNAYLNEAILTETKLTGTDFGSSNLTKTNLSKATMNITNLSDAILDQTNLSDAELSKATVLENEWITKLKEHKVVGAEEIESAYKTIVEPSGKFNFRLVKK